MAATENTREAPDAAIRAEAYEEMLSQNAGMMDGCRNWVCNLANASSMLWQAYQKAPYTRDGVNWAGFYVIDPVAPPGTQLILGPFQGKPACQTIAFGRGVCGTVAVEQEMRNVPDVLDVKNHIACDPNTLSEIVVPIMVTQRDGSKRLVGVIDIDSKKLACFGAVDEKYLPKLAQQLAEGCDWP
ncbi:uncharacterized protein BROUX77_007799 [Berkeleyomyces rouxiae]|uniref:uncharacterized protein n=1 Tax=Berkeleyomyces rouxiae TaxID=2035830 RepID=UPI003B815E2B